MKSRLIKLRNRKKNKAVIVFIHGFGGDANKTWGNFPALIAGVDEHRNWDLFSLGYPTSLAYDLKGVWRGDPDIPTLADKLRSQLSDTAFSRYQCIALIAHSMGGLIVQRALLDLKQNNVEIFNRISHAFLFATPSNGLGKASFFGFFKRQLKNMGKDSDFIKQLRKNRTQLYCNSLFLRVIVGDEDEFVSRDSSIDPFPDEYRKVVAGDHLSLVKPDSLDTDCVQIVLKGLTHDDYANFRDSAKTAVERRDYFNIVRQWEHHAAELDDEALVQLALAMDEVGRHDEAIKMIEHRKGKTTDALGVLGGRYKRQWLQEGRRSIDAKQALELYATAYDRARQKPVNYDQALYLGINIAFLQLVFEKDAEQARKTARQVLGYCNKRKGKPDKWTFATQAEVHLQTGNFDTAMVFYAKAIAKKQGATQREKASMYLQAQRILAESNSAKKAKRLHRLFRR